MRRRRRLTVDTFPFLAVLLGAMGALILVLLIFDYRAKKAARQRVEAAVVRQSAEAEQKAAARRAELLAREEERRREWEQKQAALRRTVAAQQAEVTRAIEEAEAATKQARHQDEAERQALAAARARSEKERTQLVTVKSHLENGSDQVRQGEAASRQGQATLRELTADLTQIEQAIRDLKTTRRRDPNTYTVVPYKGPQGTDRRPIAIECTTHGLIFHPDRAAHAVPFNGDEVRADLAKRIERQRPTLPDDQQKLPPYLLLLIRPDGIDTYYDLQTTLKGLPLVFGYEFIEDDWTLEFPANPEEKPTGRATAGGAKPGGGGGGGSGSGSAATANAGSPAKPMPTPASTASSGAAAPPKPDRNPGSERPQATGDPEPSRRPARVQPSHEWIIYVECRVDGVVLHPGKDLLPLHAIAETPAKNPLRARVAEMLPQQPAPLPGKTPSRPRVRFVVHVDGGRSFHAAYPALVGLPIDMDRVTLQAGDDAQTIIRGE